VPPRALWLECGPVEKKKRPPPSRQRATWLAACRRREKRPSSSTRQAIKVGRMSRRASCIWYWFVQSRASRADAWSTIFHCSLHKAASEVRYIVIFNNGSPTEPNVVSELLSLAPHRVTVLTTKHSPAEIARKKSRDKGGGGMSPRELLDCRLQSLSRTTNFAARIFSSGDVVC
jgi:hypothetical protein